MGERAAAARLRYSPPLFAIALPLSRLGNEIESRGSLKPELVVDNFLYNYDGSQSLRLSCGDEIG